MRYVSSRRRDGKYVIRIRVHDRWNWLWRLLGLETVPDVEREYIGMGISWQTYPEYQPVTSRKEQDELYVMWKRVRGRAPISASPLQ